MNTLTYAFFGTGPLAESVLAALYQAGFPPALVVTKPDAPQGRHMQLTAPHIKTWAELKHIPVLQPANLKDPEFLSQLQAFNFQLFIVASYGKILPETLLQLPQHGTLNVHPSLLPLYRGPSPIESALLDGVLSTGVSIMKLDAEMDHGPILAQTAFTIPALATAGTLEVECGQIGGALLVQTIPHYLDGTLIPKEQDHTNATFCKKISKEVGEITLETAPSEIQRKFRALMPWPGLYFFITHNEKPMRVKVTSVHLGEIEEHQDVILKVIPEGKHEISFDDFKRGYLEH